MPQKFSTVNFLPAVLVDYWRHSCRKDIPAGIIRDIPSFVKRGCVIMSISSNIRQLRKKAGLTQMELAEKLEVSIATLRRWEAGETAPNGTRIIELANVLGVAPDEIVAGGGNDVLAGSARVLLPASERSNGMLVFEGEGTRIELPPTDKGYELFNKLVENLINRYKPSTGDLGQPLL